MPSKATSKLPSQSTPEITPDEHIAVVLPSARLPVAGMLDAAFFFHMPSPLDYAKSWIAEGPNLYPADHFQKVSTY